MELLSSVLFFIISGTLIVSALGVIFSPRIIYSILFSFIAFICVAFIYFMLNSPFNAAVQIAIYGVAVSILFIFAVMMCGYHKEKNLYIAIAPRTLLSASGLFFIFLSFVVFAIEDYKGDALKSFLSATIPSVIDTTVAISKGIFTDYIFAYELLSIFLLIAIIGIGAILAFKRGEEK